MNRKQRRETMRNIQSEDLSLEVIHRNAAGIDIGNESQHSRTSWFGSVLGECTGHEESARAKKRRAGESVADEAHLWTVAKFVSTSTGDPHHAKLLAAAE